MVLNTAATRNLAVIVGVTVLLRRVDESDERVLLFVRALFFLYVATMGTLSVLTLRSIVSVHDQQRVRTPPSRNRGGDGDGSEARSQTVYEYDMRQLWTKTRGWMINATVLCVMHSRFRTVAPLVMSSLLGFLNEWSDKLTMIHVRGYKGEGTLERPWKAARGPFGSLFGGLGVQEEDAPRAEVNAVRYARAASGRKHGKCEMDISKGHAGGEGLRRRVKTESALEEVESNGSDAAGGVEEVKVE